MMKIKKILLTTLVAALIALVCGALVACDDSHDNEQNREDEININIGMPGNLDFKEIKPGQSFIIEIPIHTTSYYKIEPSAKYNKGNSIADNAEEKAPKTDYSFLPLESEGDKNLKTDEDNVYRLSRGDRFFRWTNLGNQVMNNLIIEVAEQVFDLSEINTIDISIPKRESSIEPGSLTLFVKDEYKIYRGSLEGHNAECVRIDSIAGLESHYDDYLEFIVDGTEKVIVSNSGDKDEAATLRFAENTQTYDMAINNTLQLTTDRTNDYSFYRIINMPFSESGNLEGQTWRYSFVLVERADLSNDVLIMTDWVRRSDLQGRKYNAVEHVASTMIVGVKNNSSFSVSVGNAENCGDWYVNDEILAQDGKDIALERGKEYKIQYKLFGKYETPLKISADAYASVHLAPNGYLRVDADSDIMNFTIEPVMNLYGGYAPHLRTVAVKDPIL